ncbi:hypothetical protein BS47DRAFT_1341334, partial [Hydnum rufescens UP504]
MLNDPKLKGRDAVIYHALQDAGASPTLHLVMFSPDKPLAADDLNEGEDENENDDDDGDDDDGDSDVDIKQRNDSGFGLFTIIYPYGMTADDGRELDTEPSVLRWFEGRRPKDLEGLVEVTDRSLEHYLKHSFLAYGNQPSLGANYGSICVIANVPGEDVNAPWGPLVKPVRRG